MAPFALEPGGTREISFTNMHAAPSIVALLAVGDDSARKGAYEATIELRF
ncbi:MAG: hypothetical protein HY898_11660 [Deltaproteobacteria bacterium]|nr:hypothetical protein [Deltaproteobacteria bacterium]